MNKLLRISTIESISNVLGDTNTGLTGSEIKKYLNECNIQDIDPQNTKRIRLYNALRDKQSIDKCWNNILFFVQHIMTPSRYSLNPEYFKKKQEALNSVLAFEGLCIKDDGIIKQTTKISTITELEEKVNKFREQLKKRKAHKDIFLFCKEELLVNNYFHAVFEATKSVAEKIRVKTGLNADGAELVDKAFSIKSKVPYLALNTLQSDTEKSEHTGFMNLVKGLFGMFRNTTAHAPKITWEISEQEALDILSLVSLIHRRLDESIEARKLYNNSI